MEENPKKTSLLSKTLIWFLILSTLLVVYITIKLLIESVNFRG